MNKTALLSAALLLSAQCVSAQTEDKTLVVVAGQESPLAYNQGIKDYNNRIYNQAQANFNKAIEGNSQFYQAFYNRGITELSLNDNGAAQNDFNQAVSLSENPRYYLGRAVSNARLRKFSDAMSDIDKAQNLGYDEAALCYFRGMVYLMSGNYTQAEQQYNKAIRSNDQYAFAYCDRGTLQYLRGNYKAAIDDYNTALAIKPGATFIYIFRAEAKSESGNLSGAVQDLNAALEISPDDYDLINARGQLYIKAKQYDKAQADFESLIEKDENNPSAYISMGNLCFAQKDYQKAKDYFTKAIDKDPYNYTAYNNRANAEELLFETKNADNDRKKADSLQKVKL